MFQGLFNQYAQMDDNSPKLVQQGTNVEMDGNGNDAMSDWDRHVNLIARFASVLTMELETCLAKPLVPRADNFDILSWWKMNSPKYPTLGNMVKDILAMFASTVASESAFSTERRVLSILGVDWPPRQLKRLYACKIG